MQRLVQQLAEVEAARDALELRLAALSAPAAEGVDAADGAGASSLEKVLLPRPRSSAGRSQLTYGRIGRCACRTTDAEAVLTTSDLRRAYLAVPVLWD